MDGSIYPQLKLSTGLAKEAQIFYVRNNRNLMVSGGVILLRMSGIYVSFTLDLFDSMYSPTLL